MFLVDIFPEMNNISTITLHTIIFYWRAYSGTDLPWPCSCITHAVFGAFRHKFLFAAAGLRKMSHFPWLVERVDLQRHDLSSCENATGKIVIVIIITNTSY